MVNEIQIRERINSVLQERKLNAHSLSYGDRNLWNKLYMQLVKGRTISLQTIETILNAIPDLNTEWLFRGIGSPFKDMTSPEQRLNDIEERLSALEGERETDTYPAQQHTA